MDFEEQKLHCKFHKIRWCFAWTEIQLPKTRFVANFESAWTQTLGLDYIFSGFGQGPLSVFRGPRLTTTVTIGEKEKWYQFALLMIQQEKKTTTPKKNKLFIQQRVYAMPISNL